MTTARYHLQRVTHLIEVHHPELAPHLDVLAVALVNGHDCRQRHMNLRLGILVADGVHQIAMDGREIRGFFLIVHFF